MVSEKEAKLLFSLLNPTSTGVLSAAKYIALELFYVARTLTIYCFAFILDLERKIAKAEMSGLSYLYDV